MSEVQDDDGYEGATPPPSYGELHGRVLGTGLPPSAETVDRGSRVSMVNQQDLEDTDDEEQHPLDY